MKNRHFFKRIIAGALSMILAAACLPLGLLSFAAEPPSAPEELASLEEYLGKSETVTDRYGNPVHLHYYYRKEMTYKPSAIGEGGSVIIQYVMNTNTERVRGTEDKDAEIVRSMLDRGFYVIVMDYIDNPVTSPDLDWSIQGIRDCVRKGTLVTPGREKDANADYQQNYVVPAGYDIAYNVPYFSFDKHGVAGTLERIVEVWNNDFRSTKRNSIVKWVDENGVRKTTKPIADGYDVWYSDASGKTVDQENGVYTKIGNTWASTVTDCVKPDGSFINLDVEADIIYPVGAESESLPAMVLMSSAECRVDAWTDTNRPQLTGFLFNGYIGVVAGYGYVPMSRTDHYGYFSGTGVQNSVSGDNHTYSLSAYSGILSDTAILRMLRKMGADGVEVDGKVLKLGLDPDAIGVYGNSKGGVCLRLGNPHPELLEEYNHFEGHLGETRYESYHNIDGKNYGYTDPFIADDGTSTDARIRLPEPMRFTTYDDGSTIPSGANFVYSNCGDGWKTLTSENAPFYATGTQLPGGSYSGIYRYAMNAARNLDLPAFGLVCPNIGHNLGRDNDRDWGIDTYYAFHRYANYYLQKSNPSCEIIDVDTKHDLWIAADSPIDYIYEIEDGSAIRIRFMGSIDLENIRKVSVVDAKTGEAVDGEWSAAFRSQQWTFTPYGLKDNTYYRVIVPDTVEDERGNALVEGKTLLFRTAIGTAEAPEETAGVRVVTDTDAAYFIFAKKDYSASHKTNLRLTVDNDAINNLIVYGATLADGESYDGVTDWVQVGEMTLTGNGTYVLDVTDFVKEATGRPVFKVLTRWSTDDEGYRKTISFDGANVDSLGAGSWVGRLSLASIAPPKEGEGDALKIAGFIRGSAYVDLNRDLNGNFVTTPERIGTFRILDAMEPTDRGRRFTVSFRVYDETSRLVSVCTPPSATEEDTNIPIRIFRTTAGEWTEVSFEVGYRDLADALSRGTLYIDAENKGILKIADHTAVAPSDFAKGKTPKGDGYAGEVGLNDSYTIYDTVRAVYEAGALTVDTEHSPAIYLSDITVKEVGHTDVHILGAELSTTPTKVDTLPAVAAASVDSSLPDESIGGTLSVGGGVRADDTDSRKLYVKLSLADYVPNSPAYFSFVAEGKKTTVSLYGLADAKASDAWSAGSVTARTAPANDPTSGSLNLAKVYGGASLSRYTIDGKQTITADITAYATAMKLAGANTLTLILVDDSGGDSLLGSYDFEGWESDSPAKYIGGSGGSVANTVTVTKDPDDSRNTVLRFTPSGSTQRLHFNGLFADMNDTASDRVNNVGKTFLSRNYKWTEEDIGNTYRITFRARTNRKDCYMKFGLMCGDSTGTGNLNYSAVPYGTVGEMKFAEENVWQDFSLEITVDEGMLTQEVRGLSYAISLFGIRVWNLQSGDEVLIDDIRATKLSGETLVTPISDVTGSYTFDDWTSADPANRIGGAGGSVAKTVTVTEDPENPGNQVISLKPSGGSQRLHFNGLFGDMSDTSSDKVNNPTKALTYRNYNWTEEDLGRTFRITFRAMSKGRTGSFISFGMMRGDKSTADLDESGNAVNYSAVPYGTVGVLKFAETNTWYNFAIDVTVDRNMLAHDIDGLQYAISLFGFRVLNIRDTDEILIDDLIARELPRELGGTRDFSDLVSGESPYDKTLNGGFGKNAGVLDAVEENGNMTLGIRPYAGYNRIRFSGLFGQNNVVNDKNNAAANVNHHGWSDKEIGDVWRVSFRAKSSQAVDRDGKGGKIQFGMMRGAKSAEDTDADGNVIDYSTRFYGDFKTVRFEEADTWYTFTLEFTVDKEMQAKACEDGKTYAVSYFSIVTNGLTYASDAESNVEGRPLVQIDDMVAVKIGHKGDDGNLIPTPKTERTSLGTDTVININGANDTSDLSVRAKRVGAPEAIRNTFLSFAVPQKAAIYGAKLRFYLTGAKGQTLYIYSLDNAELPSSLTWGNAPMWKGEPIATLTITEDGWQEIDITALAKENIGKTLTFALTAGELDEDLTVTTPTLVLDSAEETSDLDPATVKVKSNITLSSDFRYNVYVPVLDEIKEITLDGVAVNLYDLERTLIDGKTYYRVSKNLAAKDGTDSFTVSVLIDNGKAQVRKSFLVSIPKYATKLFANGTASEEAKTVVRDALAYIRAAKEYFGMLTDDSAATLDSLLGNFTAKSAEELGLTEDKKVVSDSGAVIDTACLNLLATPAFVFYLKDGVSETVAKSFRFASASGAPLSCAVKTAADGRIYLEVTAYAYGMNDTLTFSYTDGDGKAQSGAYNLAAYYVSPAASETVQALVLRLAQYAESAKAYRNSVLKGE